ncbi:hypothetical protein [Candidatus Thiodiazotropha sp. CDECU1]|nr:hypothetical protein [Candidatus Thiodiazotropha sp. CDECU1]
MVILRRVRLAAPIYEYQHGTGLSGWLNGAASRTLRIESIFVSSS